MAIEDGVVLAQCLRDVAGIDRAFAQFERMRRTRVERIVAQGARSSSSKAAGPIGRLVRDRMLPLVFRYVVTEKSMAWMFDTPYRLEQPGPIERESRVMDGFTTIDVQTDQTTIFVRSSGSGPPVLLLHGFPRRT